MRDAERGRGEKMHMMRGKKQKKSAIELKDDNDDGFRPDSFVARVRAGVMTLCLSSGSTLAIACVAVK